MLRIRIRKSDGMSRLGYLLQEELAIRRGLPLAPPRKMLAVRIFREITQPFGGRFFRGMGPTERILGARAAHSYNWKVLLWMKMRGYIAQAFMTLCINDPKAL